MNRALTPKQWLIASLVAEGMKNKEIAVLLGVTEHVIKNYLRDVYDKLGFWNRTEVALWYVKRTFEPEHRERFDPKRGG